MLSEWLKHLYVCPNIYGPYCIRRIIVYATQKHPWLKVKVITINLSLSNHCDIIHILPVYHGYVYTILQDLQTLRGIDWSRALLIFLYQISMKYKLFKILSSVYIYIYIICKPYESTFDSYTIVTWYVCFSCTYQLYAWLAFLQWYIQILFFAHIRQRRSN